MARAYIVEGCTGEYSDHRTWPVAIFTSRGRAVRFTSKANQWLRDNNLHDEFYSSVSGSRRRALAARSPFDPLLVVDYTGASYCVISATLDPELPR